MTDTPWEPPSEWSGPDLYEPLCQVDEEMAQYVAMTGDWPIEKARWMVASVRLRKKRALGDDKEL